MFIVGEQVCAGLEGVCSNPDVVRRNGASFGTEVGSDSSKSVRRRERDWDKLHKAIR
jgi:hypothetical protein